MKNVITYKRIHGNYVILRKNVYMKNFEKCIFVKNIVFKKI